MKKIFIFIVAALFGTVAMANTTIVGNEDNTTGWWSAFSDYYTIEPNKTLTLKFTNYSSKANNHNNWLAVVTTDADRNAEGYSEYFVLRADNYGWQGGLNTIDNKSWFVSLTSNYNWDTFKNDMYGAKVKLTLTRDGTKLTVHADITTAGGTEYFENFEVANCGNGEQTIRAFLTVNGGCLDLTKSEITDNASVTGIQSVKTVNNGKDVRYNLAGQQVADGFKGFVIVNGLKVMMK